MANIFKNCKNVTYYTIGEGAFAQLRDILSVLRNTKKGSVVYAVDEFFSKEKLMPQLGMETGDVYISVNTKQEPHADYINELASNLRTNFVSALPSAIVGMGGGTSMDIGKCLSVLLTNPGPVENYQGWDLLKNPGIYKIGIPTLSGTGAEATRTAVLTSKIKKLGINSDHSVFDQIIMDPTFLKTVPKDQFFYTAMDCYIHNVESLRGRIIDEMSASFAEKSLELIREVFLKKMDYNKLMVGSYLGGCAVANSNVGICHPLSYGLSLVLGYRHGIANCIAFDQLGEYYTKEVLEFREIKKKFEIELPQKILSGVSDEQIDRMAEATLKNERPLTNAFGDNWRNIFTKNKVIELFKKM